VTDRPSPRALAWYCAGLAVSAGLLWAGSATEPAEAQAAPWLGGVALLALAGIGGVVATGGVPRRLVGALLGLAGVGVLGFALRAMLGTGVTAAPLLAVAGAAMLLAVGVLVLVRERRLPRLGARYAAPGERRAERDPDRAAWQELDAGRDPTVDPAFGPPGDAGDDPGDGPRNSAV
jgi:hypothetical protein